MEDSLLKAALLTATGLTGLLCGAALDQSIKQLPARHIIGVRNRVVHDADRANNLPHRFGAARALHVRRVANHQRRASCLVTRTDSGNLAFGVEQNLVNGSV